MSGFGPGVGSVRYKRSDMRRIVCAFPEETFQEIRERAVKEKTSFAEQVRMLTEWGLESDAVR